MKKKKIILIFAIFIFSTSLTKVESSTNLDITNDTTIKYKWYIEEKVEGMYYPKGESLEGYYEDINDIKYGKESDLDEKYCQYSRDKYVVTMDVERIYKKIIDAQYVKIIGISEDTNIRIFANTTEINYSIRKMGTDEIIIDLNRHINISWYACYCLYIFKNILHFFFGHNETFQCKFLYFIQTISHFINRTEIIFCSSHIIHNIIIYFI